MRFRLRSSEHRELWHEQSVCDPPLHPTRTTLRPPPNTLESGGKPPLCLLPPKPIRTASHRYLTTPSSRGPTPRAEGSLLAFPPAKLRVTIDPPSPLFRLHPITIVLRYALIMCSGPHALAAGRTPTGNSPSSSPQFLIAVSRLETPATPILSTKQYVLIVTRLAFCATKNPPALVGS